MDISVDSIGKKSVQEAQPAVLPIAGRHIPALDGIRGVAILLVIVNHLIRSLQAEFLGHDSRILKIGTFGWIGVDLFFVLSGFLITGILFDQKASNHYFKNFYMRRALRIFPLYFGTLLIIMVLRLIFPGGGELINGRENPAWMWVYMTNVVISVKGAGAFGILDHFWSLAVEEHFYLLWPFVVYVLNRQNLIRVSVLIIVAVAVLRLALTLGGSTSPDVLYFLTPLRMDALCLGSLLALLVRSPEGIQKLLAPSRIVAIVAGAAIVVMVLSRDTFSNVDSVMQTAGYSLLAIFFGALLIQGVASPLQHVFNSGILRWFGKYSYGLYVWHPIVFILLLHTGWARAVRGGNGMLEMLVSVALALGVTIAITLLSWNLWESQFLKLKRHFE